MNKFFNDSNPFWTAMGMIFDMFVLNILWLICSIPLFTIGASTTAFYYVMIDIARGESPYIAKTFFKSFRQNFKQGVLLGLIVMFTGAFLLIDIYLCYKSQSGIFSFFLFFFGIIFLFWCFTTLYLFPLLSKFDKSTKEIFILAFTLSIKHFPRSLAMLLAAVIGIWLCHLLAGFILIVPALVVFCQTIVFLPILKPYLPEDYTI
jgi:uncharacterized membrane protein YesL